MYTEDQVNDMLSQVEKEFEKTLGSIAKSQENIEEEVENEASEEEVMVKSEEENVEYSDEDFEAIDEIYSSMSKSEKEIHYQAIKKAIFGESMEKSEDEDDEDLSPHAKEQKAKKAQKQKVIENMASGAINRGYDKAAHSTDKLVNKNEEEDEEKDEEIKMAKSEIENLKSENEELKKNIDSMNDLLNKLFNSKKAPAQKAVTATSYIAKSEEQEVEQFNVSSLSKGEIVSKLKVLDYSSLSKSDRDNINEYCLNNASVDKIKHLIKE